MKPFFPLFLYLESSKVHQHNPELSNPQFWSLSDNLSTSICGDGYSTHPYSLPGFISLYLLTYLASTAPNALSDLKAKLKGFLKSKTSKKTEKPAEKPAEAAKPVEATPTNGAAPTTTTAAEPVPAAARTYHHTSLCLSDTRLTSTSFS